MLWALHAIFRLQRVGILPGAPREASMVERFMERARQVMVLATEEARRRRHGAVGPAHVLMAILRDGGTLGGRKLEHLRVSPERLAVEVERVLSEMPESAAAGEPAFAPELKAVLEATLEEQRRCLYAVDPQDLLRGLLADDRSTACRILAAAGADLDQARLLTRLSFGNPLTAGDVRFLATSKWRLQI